MVLERNYRIQQGDTKRIVIPVFNSDAPDTDFYTELGTASVSFFIAESFEAQSATLVVSDTNIQIKQFGNVKTGSGDFDFSDVDVAEDFTIPSTQNVIVVTLLKSETETLTFGEKVYQCRVEDTATPSNRFTPVKGRITVEPSTPTVE